MLLSMIIIIKKSHASTFIYIAVKDRNLKKQRGQSYPNWIIKNEVCGITNFQLFVLSDPVLLNFRFAIEFDL